MCALSQRGQYIGLRQRGGDALELGQIRQQLLQQLFVEELFPRQGAILRRERFVLKRLQLGRDVALGVLERLAPTVVIGHLRGLAVGDFDVETVHAVVAHLQRGDAAQLIEIGIVATGDDATVAHHRRRFGHHGALEQGVGVFGQRECGVQLGQQRGGIARIVVFGQLFANLGQACKRIAQ